MNVAPRPDSGHVTSYRLHPSWRMPRAGIMASDRVLLDASAVGLMLRDRGGTSACVAEPDILRVCDLTPERWEAVSDFLLKQRIIEVAP